MSTLSAQEHGSKYSGNPDHRLSNSSQQQRGNGSTDKEEVVYTVEEAVDQLGFGVFQIFVTLFSGLTWLADAMEVMLLSVLSPVVACEWGLKSWEEAFITSVVFIGILAGAFIWGRIADITGRKTMLFAVVVLTFVFGFASAFSPSYPWLLVLRGLTGCALAGNLQAVTYYVEFLPRKARGISVILLQIWWSIGTITAAVLAMAILPNIKEYLNWRVYVGVCAIPVLFALPLFMALPESARYLISRGKDEKAMKVIRYIAWMNRRPTPKGRLVTQEEKERILGMTNSNADTAAVDDRQISETSLIEGEFEKQPLLGSASIGYGHTSASASDIEKTETKFHKAKRMCREGLVSTGQDLALMFKGGMWKTTILVLNIWAGCALMYYGAVLLTPIVLESDSPRCGRENHSDNVSDCQELTTSFYTKILWTSAAEFPGILLTLLLIECIGRKITMALEFLGFTITTGLLLLCIPEIYLTILMFGARGFVTGVFQVIIVYTPEVYPTNVRGVALGVSTSVARLGALATPFVAQALFPVNEYATIGVYSGTSLVLAVFCLLLPIETKGRTLKDTAK